MKIKVLIVDDSLIFRKAVESSLSGETDIEVAGSVRNGVKAMEFIRSERPDLVTLDVEMPEMDGLETLKEIQAFNSSNPGAPPVGVIMVSAHTQKGADTTIKALESGAFDFISKPEAASLNESHEILRRRLLVKIRYFASRRGFSPHSMSPPVFDPPQSPRAVPAARALFIGVSTGGPKALSILTPALCERLTIPIFVVQHMPPTFTRSLADSLNNKCAYTVLEARNGETVRRNHVYIAPGDRHLLVRKKDGEILTILNRQPPENGTRPSADVLFRSAAAIYGKHVIALILTGMGVDGTQGAGAVKRAGGCVIAQDEATSVVWGMPGSAAAAGHVDRILPLEKIPDIVFQIVNK